MELSVARTMIRSRCSLAEDELDDEQLDALVEQAVGVFDESLSLASIHPGSGAAAALILDCMISVAYIRSSQASLSYRVKTGESETYRQQIVENNIALARQLTADRDRIMANSGLLNEVHVSRITRTNRFGEQVPFQAAKTPMPVELTVSVNGAVELSWTESTALDFLQYFIYRDTEPGVEDSAQLTSSGTVTGYGVKNTARRVADIQTIWTTVHQDNPGSGTFYYIVGVMTKNGRITYSNEVSATI